VDRDAVVGEAGGDPQDSGIGHRRAGTVAAAGLAGQPTGWLVLSAAAHLTKRRHARWVFWPDPVGLRVFPERARSWR
jgi:hypothetical protein